MAPPSPVVQAQPRARTHGPVSRIRSRGPSNLPEFRAFRTLVAVAAALFCVPGAATDAEAQATTPALKSLDPTELSFWKSVRFPQVSNDGLWFAYQLAPNEGDAEVVARPTGDGEERRFAIGEPSGGGGGFFGGGAAAPVRLSGDGAWLAFTTYPTQEEAERARAQKKRTFNGVTVVNLAGGETHAFDGVRAYEFAGEQPAWFVMQRSAPEGAPRGSGTDLLLLELATGLISTVGSVGSFDVSEDGRWLAWTTQSPDLIGNGVAVRDFETGVVRALDSERAHYTQLSWADDQDAGPDLTVLRGVPEPGETEGPGAPPSSDEDQDASEEPSFADTAFVALGFTGLDSGPLATTLVDPATLDGFPEGWRISPTRGATWSDDRTALFFGIDERSTAPRSENGRPDVRPVAGTPGAMQTPPPSLDDEEDLPTLVLWHGRDPRLQSQQQVQENRDRQYSYLSAYIVDDRRFVQIATDALRDIALAPGQRFAVGYDSRAYDLRDAIDGGRRRDVHAVDTRTGQSTPVLSAQRYAVYPAPDGRRFAYYRDGDYHVYDFTRGESTNVTESAPVSFVNVEDDHNVDRPPLPMLGWSADSRRILLSDAWDVWSVSVDGEDAVNLTGTGRDEGVRHRRRIVYDRDEEGVDLSQPLYFDAYGERTKKNGIVRVVNGRSERILWDDARFNVRRARDAETFVYSRETFQVFPDYWAADRSFDDPVRLTDANPQQSEYAWSAGARLVDYVSEKGDSLQGALFLPAGYQEGESYPTVVYIYERLSQNLHSYSVPNETRAFNPSVYTSRGYAVLMPDIAYQINDPGMSAVWCVVPAVHAAIETGVVDAERVGLHGHSWGGYQTSFLITQTDIFAGAIAGAPLTDMVSMYNSVYWNTGTADMAIFESSQGRFKGSYLDNYDAYIRNSPAFHVDGITTPLVLLHNEKDGAVDFNQGITFFNTLREREKDVVLLQYVGENHGLREPKNQKDYTVRMMEFFDHYLLGRPAPEWWEKGVPRLEMEDHLRARQKKAKVVS